MELKCLLIADDLTGGADSGAQFARRGLSTLLVSLEDDPHFDFTQYLEMDVLVINTDSRGLGPEKAFRLISDLLGNYERDLFPLVYKKIDSTLRGNIGYEIDAVLNRTGISAGFMAPSFPEQNRTLVGGIMMVAGKPLSLTEASRDAVSPVRESHVQRLLRGQSSHKIGKVDLIPVASGPDQLKRAVQKEHKKGNRIIVFDAVLRRDLSHIVEVGFSLKEKPLFIGSAGLAEEVAKKLAPTESPKLALSFGKEEKPASHLFLISGSASAVAHEQLSRVEQNGKAVPFQLNKSLILKDGADRRTEKREFSIGVGNALAKGHVLLRSFPERLMPRDPKDPPVHLEITKVLGEITLSALEGSKVGLDDLALVIVGGDTARSIFHSLQFKALEIIGEIMEGVIMNRLVGGRWSGLRVITKAGAFGKEDTLEKIMEILERKKVQPGTLRPHDIE